jgi:hypothetical protein
MKGKYVIQDLNEALRLKAFPTVTVWNRLEGRPRRDDFSRALKAEVRDALWMLTKQWQLGEFQGDDAGWPILGRMHMHTTRVTKYRPANGATEALSTSLPLETKVEQRPLAWRRGGMKARLDLRVQLGRQWRKLLADAGLAAHSAAYLTRYPFELPAKGPDSDEVHAHHEEWQQYAAIAGRCVDGGELYLHLTGDAAHRASDGIPPGTDAERAALDALGTEFRQWVDTLYSQPSRGDAWKPSSLEYGFDCSAPHKGEEKVLSADEYFHGHLDWYSFDFASGAGGLGDVPGAPAGVEEGLTRTFIPAPVEFDGMPDTRWWALEDRRTHFGDVKPSTTDLALLMLVEFGLVYANDWFLVPFRLPAGTLARVEGLAVVNTFGERFWVQAAGKGQDEDWQRWSMFTLATRGSANLPADTSLFVPPVVAKLQEGPPQEEVYFVRDEMANMAWAMESVVPGVSGRGRPGKDFARETLAFHRQLLEAGGPTATEEYRAAVSYLAMTSVPENWIPFVPVHIPGSVRQVQLQRGRMPRILEGGPTQPPKIPPRTSLVREGLEALPLPLPYFIHEEEVPRAGIRVTQSFQRTRGEHGEPYVWLGVRKQVGRGERTSGLAFDVLADVKPAT